jgi:dolichol-phosphate mannosyltransferase
MTDLSIVVPCHNDADGLKDLLPRLRNTLAHHRIPALLYVVDDASTDDTAAVARQLGAQVLGQRTRGYGGALAAALSAVETDFVLTIDTSCAHATGLAAYLYAARQEADILIASRYMPQGFVEMPLTRSLLSRALNASFRRLLDLPFHDLSSGYRLYRRRTIAGLPLENASTAALLELLIKAYCEGYAIKEIPMHYSAGPRYGRDARLWDLGRDYLRTFRAMWRLRNSAVSADYDTRAFFSRIPLQRYWQRRRYSIITKYTADAVRIMDAGCGSTQLLNRSPQTVGLDPLLRKLRFMRLTGRRLVNGSTLALPFRDAVFDAVISSQVIEHLPQDDRIFAELSRCLKPGGTLVLGTVDYGGWQWPLIEWAYGIAKPTGYADEHITHYTRKELFDRLASLGFAIEGHEYILGGEIIIKAKKRESATGRDLSR